jgi:hypothetical protein
VLAARVQPSDHNASFVCVRCHFSHLAGWF